MMGRSIYEVPHNDNVPHILEGKDLKTLLVASIQTLKHNSKKCGKEVFHLVQEYVESEVTKEIFEELDALVESHSVKIKLLGLVRVSPYQN